MKLYFFLKVSSTELVQEIHQMLMDREETCHRTCFSLQLDGVTMDNFAELKTIEGLKDGSVIKVMEGINLNLMCFKLASLLVPSWPLMLVNLIKSSSYCSGNVWVPNAFDICIISYLYTKSDYLPIFCYVGRYSHFVYRYTK